MASADEVVKGLKTGAINGIDAARMLSGETESAVRLRGRFTPGQEVHLFERVPGVEFQPGALEVLATQRVDREGNVEFVREVEIGGTYWIAGDVSRDGDDPEWRSVQMTAKVAPMEKVRRERPGTDEARPFQAESRQNAPTEEPVSGEAVPHPRQEQVPEDQPQRSNTATGSAVPHDPDEPQPTMGQHQVSPETVQRSSTPLGEATIIQRGEFSPSTKQEDVPEELVQRSSTRTGEAYPKPDGDSISIEQDRDSSALKAVGGRNAPRHRSTEQPEGRPRSVQGGDASIEAPADSEHVEVVDGEMPSPNDIASW